MEVGNSVVKEVKMTEDSSEAAKWNEESGEQRAPGPQSMVRKKLRKWKHKDNL